MYYKRRIYLKRIEPFIGAPLIKVITGMRRVGKSVFLKQVTDLIQARGGNPLYLNMELIENHRFRDMNVLYRYIKEFTELSALLIDEVQDIRGWEKLAASLIAEGEIDIYISGSNASMLASELASSISGRYVELHIYPLGLAEFVQFRGEDSGSLPKEFGLFLRLGGMPGIHSMQLTTEVVYQYLGSVMDTVILNDVIMRNSIRSIPLLESVFSFLADNVGSLHSGKSIADYMRSHGRNTTAGTVIDYIRNLADAYAIYNLKRFDIRGKKLLSYTEKAYLSDLSFRHALFGFRDGAISGFLENIVCLELMRRDYTVFVGESGNRELDFIAEKGDETVYVQVAYHLASPDTIEREFSVLESIRDNYQKIVLSMDRDFPSRGGIRHAYLPEFLVEDWL